MSLPLHWNDNGLPIGMMFSAAYGNDALLIQLAGQLEQAAPWRDRRPPPFGSAASAAGTMAIRRLPAKAMWETLFAQARK